MDGSNGVPPSGDGTQAHKRNLWRAVRNGIRVTRTISNASPELIESASRQGRAQLSRLEAIRVQTDAAQNSLQDLIIAAEQFGSALRRTQESMRTLLDENDCTSLLGTPCAMSLHESHENMINLVRLSIDHARNTASMFETHINPALERAESVRSRMYDALSVREQLALAVDTLAHSSKAENQLKAAQLTAEHRESAAAFARHQYDACVATSSLVEDVRAQLAWGLVSTVTAQSAEVGEVARSLRMAADLAAVAPVPRSSSAPRPSLDELLLSSPSAPVGQPRWVTPALTSSGKAGQGGGAGGGIRAGEAQQARVPPTCLLPLESTPMLPGECLISRVEQVCDVSAGVVGVLVTSQYRVRWFPAGYTPPAPHAQGQGQQGGQGRAYRADSCCDMNCLLSYSEGGSSSSGSGSVYSPAPYSSLPLLAIARMEVTGGPRGMLALCTSDMRVVRYSFALAEADPETVSGMLHDHMWVKEASFPGTCLAALRGIGAWPNAQLWPLDGWSLYHPQAEYDRCATATSSTMGIPLSAIRFALSSLNAGYRTCSTYPEVLIMPTTLAESTIVSAAKFRSKARLPAITWFRGTVTLSRCSQPLTGVFGARSGDDEKLLAALASDVPPGAGPILGKHCGLTIVDARPRLNAAANAAKGGGTETIGHYQGAGGPGSVTLDFLNIDNIHVVRDALAALRGWVLREARRSTVTALEAGTGLDVALGREREGGSGAGLGGSGSGAWEGDVPTPASLATLLHGVGGASGAGIAGEESLPALAALDDEDDVGATTPQEGGRKGGVGGAAEQLSDAEGSTVVGELTSSHGGRGSGRFPVVDFAGDHVHTAASSAHGMDAEAEARRARMRALGAASADTPEPASPSLPISMTTPIRSHHEHSHSALQDVRLTAAGGGHSRSGSSRYSGSASGGSAGAAAGAGRQRRGSVTAAVTGLFHSTKHFLQVLTGRSRRITGRKKAGSARGGSADLGSPDSSRASPGGPGGSVGGTSGQQGGAYFGSPGTPSEAIHGEGIRAAAMHAQLSGGELGRGYSGSFADFSGLDEGGAGQGLGGGPGELAQAAVSKRYRGPPVWLKLNSIQLEGAVRIAKRLLAGTSVCVHCSDGWDRTSALTSLAQLMVDPWARTIQGFAVLVEKEWVSFGHRFGRRNGTGGCGHDRGDAGDGQRAPIFLQWLDCVWQMVRQHPWAYQFNERLLVLLAEHAYSARFGTFLYDCERDRGTAHVRENTMSLWTVALHPDCLHMVTNVEYSPPTAPVCGEGVGAVTCAVPGLLPVLPSTSVPALAVWPYFTVKWSG